MPRITFPLEEVEQAMADQAGFCVECGEGRDCCEPDAHNYKCDSCGMMAVFGAEELLIMDLVV